MVTGWVLPAAAEILFAWKPVLKACFRIPLIFEKEKGWAESRIRQREES